MVFLYFLFFSFNLSIFSSTKSLSSPSLYLTNSIIISLISLFFFKIFLIKGLSKTKYPYILSLSANLLYLIDDSNSFNNAN
uniref:Uncharacterized protein n=1 Tax=viral metagenome TaxID=1070528 RepID=A0A6C0J8Z7_9ZZZZ